MGIDGQEVRFSLHVIHDSVFGIKVLLFVGEIASVVLEEDDFEVEPGKKDLNLFGVTKKPAESIVFPLIEGGNDMIGIGWEFVYVFVKVLESDSGCSTLSMFLVGTIEKDKVRVHGFSEAFVIVKLGKVFAPGDLLILLLDLQLFFREVLADKNY
jgi:hypothetical protein